MLDKNESKDCILQSVSWSILHAAPPFYDLLNNSASATWFLCTTYQSNWSKYLDILGQWVEVLHIVGLEIMELDILGHTWSECDQD